MRDTCTVITFCIPKGATGNIADGDRKVVTVLLVRKIPFLMIVCSGSDETLVFYIV